MTCCPKCAGCLIDQYLDWGEPAEPYCINCGYRENKPLTEPMRERYMRKEKCLNCKEKAEAGYTQCLKCRKYQHEYKLKTRRKVEA